MNNIFELGLKAMPSLSRLGRWAERNPSFRAAFTSPLTWSMSSVQTKKPSSADLSLTTAYLLPPIHAMPL